VELNHDFSVSVPVEQAWAVLTDLERIAPCMPGAQLQEVDGDEYRGVVKVKVGPITAQYKGTARIVERDDTAHRAVLRAEGREARGQGTAAATITATLEEREGATGVHITTDMEISGKVAQFGRGVLAEVSEKLLDQFVHELEANVLSGPTPEKAPIDAAGSGGAGAASVSPAVGEAAGHRVIAGPDAQPVDLLDAAGGSVLKRALPLVIGFVILAALRRLRRRR
jgi:carbon monoxide dehydrogenase subunit G